MEYVLGIDLGTSYFKLGLFNAEGELAGLGRVPVDKDVCGRRAELSVDRFWKLLRQGLSQACEVASARPQHIKALAYASQANTFVLLNKDKTPLTPLILWTDERAEQVPAQLVGLGHHEDFTRITGQGQSYTPSHAATKILWLQENEPAVWAKTARFMTISDYLTWSLTGKYVADAATAALLAMTNAKEIVWWADALTALGLEDNQVSSLRTPGTTIGQINETGQQLLGLNKQTLFVLGGLDHFIAAIGAGVGQIADVSESTGTVLACINFARKYSPRAHVCTGPSIRADEYWQLTWHTNGAAALDWYRQNFVPDRTISELVSLAADVPAGSEGLVALPSVQTYPGLEGFPHREAQHHHGHFIRATMESTAYTLSELIERLAGSVKPRAIAATGGGTASHLWLQIKADMLAVPFVTTNCAEPACRGAAMLAATAVGWFHSVSDCSHQWVSAQTENRPVASVQNEYEHWKRDAAAHHGG